jgi:hypothetical protein
VSHLLIHSHGLDSVDRSEPAAIHGSPVRVRANHDDGTVVPRLSESVVESVWAVAKAWSHHGVFPESTGSHKVGDVMKRAPSGNAARCQGNAVRFHLTPVCHRSVT